MAISVIAITFGPSQVSPVRADDPADPPIFETWNDEYGTSRTSTLDEVLRALPSPFHTYTEVWYHWGRSNSLDEALASVARRLIGGSSVRMVEHTVRVPMTVEQIQYLASLLDRARDACSESFNPSCTAANLRKFYDGWSYRTTAGQPEYRIEPGSKMAGGGPPDWNPWSERTYSDAYPKDTVEKDGVTIYRYPEGWIGGEQRSTGMWAGRHDPTFCSSSPSGFACVIAAPYNGSGPKSEDPIGEPNAGGDGYRPLPPLCLNTFLCTQQFPVPMIWPVTGHPDHSSRNSWTAIFPWTSDSHKATPPSKAPDSFELRYRPQERMPTLPKAVTLNRGQSSVATEPALPKPIQLPSLSSSTVKGLTK